MKIVVIGGGAVGLFCARELLARGDEVIVLEADEDRHRSASRGAAGMLGPFSETLMELPGAHPRLLELGLQSLALWREMAGAHGALLLGGGRERHKALANVKAKADAVGFPAQWEGDALLLPSEAAIDPSVAFSLLNVPIRFGARVLRVEASGVVLESGEKIDADRVVLAPGIWGDALGEVAPALKQLSPMKGVLLELEGDFVAPGAVVRAADVYLVGREGGRIIVGATMEPGRFDLDVEPQTLDALQDAAARVFPALREAKRIGAWAGIRPMSPDWSPIIGQSGRAIIAAGHSRNGWLLAPITGKIVSAIVHDDPLPELWAAFGPGRFESAP